MKILQGAPIKNSPIDKTSVHKYKNFREVCTCGVCDIRADRHSDKQTL